MRIFLLLLLILGGCMAQQEHTMEEESAIFAGGCFWCIEAAFQELEGVNEAISGYTGGNTTYPNYREVTKGTTGHYEAVKVKYNPKKISYEELLEVFWKNIDPTQQDGQFSDKGSQYRTAIFYLNQSQKKKAERTKQKVQERFKEPVATKILPAKEFHRAEEAHQDYYKKNKISYNLYKKGSGREEKLQKIWGQDQLKQRLTDLQYRVTQEGATEPAFNNTYWDNKIEGIYVDIVSGEPLFSSRDKFESGTGWPSFTKSLEEQNIVKSKEWPIFGRTEVKSKKAGSHLGHVFDDGPEPTGKRYCINSAALEFIPKQELKEKGYAEYEKLFDKS